MNIEKTVFFFLTTLASILLVVFLGEVFYKHQLNSQLANYSMAGSILFQAILMIWMIRDCLSRRFEKNTTLINWITGIVFFGVIGTTIYYLKVKSKNIGDNVWMR